MIIYTLLSSYPKQELTNVLLTSSVIYYIVYCMLPISDHYNYMILSAIVLVDLYFTKYRHSKSRCRSGRRRHVTFDKSSPSVHTYKPWMTPQHHYQPPMDYIPPPVHYMPPMHYMPPPVHYTTPPHLQPPATPTQTETFPTIDNRHLVPVEPPPPTQYYEESEVSDDMTYMSEDIS